MRLRQFRGRALGLGVALLLLAVFLFAPAAFSSVNANWGAGTKAPLPSGAASTNQFVGLSAVSCHTDGICLGAGNYNDISGHQQGLLLLLPHGATSWIPRTASLPTGAAASPGVFLTSASCTSFSVCAAVGSYIDSSNHQQGLLLTTVDGATFVGTKAALPNGATDPGVDMSSVVFIARHVRRGRPVLRQLEEPAERAVHLVEVGRLEPRGRGAAAQRGARPWRNPELGLVLLGRQLRGGRRVQGQLQRHPGPAADRELGHMDGFGGGPASERGFERRRVVAVGVLSFGWELHRSRQLRELERPPRPVADRDVGLVGHRTAGCLARRSWIAGGSQSELGLMRLRGELQRRRHLLRQRHAPGERTDRVAR